MSKLKEFQPKLVQLVAALLATISFGAPALAQSQPLKSGTYSCWTLSLLYKAPPSPDSLSEVNRRALNLKVDPNARPMSPPDLFMMPAIFGNVILDGKGRYRFTAIRQSGTYGFDRSRGLPTFTGDLGAMKLVEYSGTGTSFVVGWQGVNYQCAVARKPVVPAAVSAGTKVPNAAYVSWVGPKLTSARAADFEGLYEGSYACSNANSRLELELKPRTDGTISAVFKFGGFKTPEGGYSLGSFSMKGTWQGTHFVLKGDQWIQQPPGYSMIDIEGDVTTKGVAGTVLFNTCDSFAAARMNR